MIVGVGDAGGWVAVGVEVAVAVAVAVAVGVNVAVAVAVGVNVAVGVEVGVNVGVGDTIGVIVGVGVGPQAPTDSTVVEGLPLGAPPATKPRVLYVLVAEPPSCEVLSEGPTLQVSLTGS